MLEYLRQEIFTHTHTHLYTQSRVYYMFIGSSLSFIQDSFILID